MIKIYWNENHIKLADSGTNQGVFKKQNNSQYDFIFNIVCHSYMASWIKIELGKQFWVSKTKGSMQNDTRNAKLYVITF